MEKVLLIDGNSIMNRAFYGIMGNKMLMTKDGKYTNAVYGFLAILFKNMEEVHPDYILVAFDSKTAAGVRKQIYDGYKKNRHGMPNELAEQMPVIKEVLKAMNIQTLEMPEYEGDDILGTYAKTFVKEGKDIYILSGDRDLFQLVEDNITVRIPRTKMGKTETEIYTKQKIEEEYGLEPEDLIELKGLMGDSSDEIPGVSGIGPKTGTSIMQKYKTIDNLYKALAENTTDFKGKVKENLVNGEDMAKLSRELGRIKTDAPIKDDINDIKVTEWNKDEVTEIFKRLNFKRYLERFNLSSDVPNKTIEIKTIQKNIGEIEIGSELIFYANTKQIDDETRIIKKDITEIGLYDNQGNIVYSKVNDIQDLKSIFENENIKKIGYNLKEIYVILKEYGINMKGIIYDAEIAAYVLSPTTVKHDLKSIANQYLDIDLDELIPKEENQQLTMFDTAPDTSKEIGAYVYALKELYKVTMEKISEEDSKELFENIEIPLITVLGEMQFNGMIAKKDELEEFGKDLKVRLEKLTQEIYDLAGESFNINSPQQLGKILFEKLKLTEPKKTKKGYATDVDTLEGIRDEHEIVGKILDYRGLTKLNSTYVDGLMQFINPKDSKIHAVFNQTITATGRISCTDPNLQNIPSHEGEGKTIKKAFKATEGYVFVDADYSQIELRVLAHIAKDENMINAFKNDEDIHREVASRVFNTPMAEVTKEQRSRAKAVNFGIIYGITSFGLSQQLKTDRKQAQEYIDNYLEKYKGIHSFMEGIVKQTEELGYVETAFGRRRYVPELKSNNYAVRQFGSRVAMNTPIQGTAADIMKIAMNKLYKELKGLDARIVLQVHDELIIEVRESQKEQAKEILKSCMEGAANLDVPLKVEVSEGKSWFELK